MNKQIVEVAMAIILNAGNARNYIKAASDAFISKDYNDIEKNLVIAEEFIRKAHIKQTEIIQDEARGISHETSILFIHAQDTLMTVMSEINMTRNFTNMLLSIIDVPGGKI